MTKLGIDHLIFVTPNLDATCKEFEDLGFRTSPRNVHPHFGTANHILALQDSYFELIGVEHDDPEDRFGIEMFQSQIDRGGDMEVLALRTENAYADCKLLTDGGFEMTPASLWERGAVMRDGSEPTAIFATTGFPAQATPGTGFIYCEHRTPEVVWHKDWQHHPNGAVNLQGVSRPLIGTAEEAVQAYANVFGTEQVSRSGEDVIVDLGAGQCLKLVADSSTTTITIKTTETAGMKRLNSINGVELDFV